LDHQDRLITEMKMINLKALYKSKHCRLGGIACRICSHWM